MAVDPLTAGIELATAAIGKIWPDKSAAEAAQLAAAVAIVQGQLDVNRAEAASPSAFTSGWRPAIGWICGAACAWGSTLCSTLSRRTAARPGCDAPPPPPPLAREGAHVVRLRSFKQSPS